MANIKNFEMSKELFSKSYLSVSKSFFGLSTRVVYNPTGSQLNGYSYEYTPEAGQRLQSLLSADESELDAVVQNFGKVNHSDIGAIRLEACISADRQFAALQLFTYSQYLSKPITDVKIYEGHAAETISSVIL